MDVVCRRRSQRAFRSESTAIHRASYTAGRTLSIPSSNQHRAPPELLLPTRQWKAGRTLDGRESHQRRSHAPSWLDIVASRGSQKERWRGLVLRFLLRKRSQKTEGAHSRNVFHRKLGSERWPDNELEAGFVVDEVVSAGDVFHVFSLDEEMTIIAIDLVIHRCRLPPIAAMCVVLHGFAVCVSRDCGGKDE